MVVIALPWLALCLTQMLDYGMLDYGDEQFIWPIWLRNFDSHYVKMRWLEALSLTCVWLLTLIYD